MSDWVVLKNGMAYCERCGTSTELPKPPIDLTRFCDELREIVKDHDDCPPPTFPAVGREWYEGLPHHTAPGPTVSLASGYWIIKTGF